ncbi:MAG: DHA2 family efflux MFS transporter permease subunit [Alphaproteobacteria bacterium]|nr:DHA2 family efflux MFS transporter permease subunit [Alphaproteobacteria bacterium]MCB9928072.1 DHA2 family efflux MFS transporter permease subunit [Alphaproteobacteria bacterium]
MTAAPTPEREAETIEVLSARYGAARYRWLVVSACLAGALGMVLSSVSMNVAVPSVMGAFGVGQDQAQWIATGYLATMVIGMLLNAWLIAALGQRLTFLVIVAVFLVGSAIGATSTSIDMLIVARIMQGIPAGVMQPFSMMVNFQVFPPERRGTAMGIFGMGVVLAPVFGPLLGGIAIDTLGWRYIFAMPLPFIAVSLVLGSLFLPERAQKGPFPPFDWTGLALLATALALILSGLTSGQRLGWTSDAVIGRLALGSIIVAAFVWWERRAKRPLLDFTLFRNPRFACAMAVSFIFGVCMFGSSYVVPVFAQTVQGYTAMRAGWLLALGGSIMVFMFPLSGRVSDTLPPQWLILSGLVTFAIGFILMHRVDVNVGFFLMAGLSAFTRIGLSWVLTPLNATSLRYVPPEKLASASSNANFFRQLGGGMGIAVLVAVLETRTAFHATALTATQTPANSTSAETLGMVASMLAPTGLPDGTAQNYAITFLGQIVHANAYMFGFQDVFLVLGLVTLAATIPAWFVRRPKPATVLATAPTLVSARPPAPSTDTDRAEHAPPLPPPLSKRPLQPRPVRRTGMLKRRAQSRRARRLMR